MDYGNILKRAWSVTWRYRILWVFGLLAGGAGGYGGGGGGSNTNYTLDETDLAGLERGFERIAEYLPVIIAVGIVLLLLGVMFWIVSVAARGGLVYLVNEAEENRPVRGRDGWSVGFAKWGRVFLLDIVLGLPFLLLALLIVGVAVVPLVTASIQGTGADAAVGVFGFCGMLMVGGLVLVVLGFVVGLLQQLAIRFAILDDMSAMSAIGAGWRSLRSRFKDLFVMWLVLFAVGIAYGLFVGVFAVMFGIGTAFAAVGEMWAVVGILVFVLFLVMLLPTAIYSAFLSAAWTVFFRRLTGRDAGIQPTRAPAAYGYTPVAPPAPTQPVAEPAPQPTAPAPPAGDLLPPPPAPPAGDLLPPPPAPPAEPPSGE